MHWVRNHPYFDALFAAGVLILVGVLIVRARVGVVPASETDITWGGGGVALDTTSRPTNIPSQGAGDASHAGGSITRAETKGYIPLNPGTSARAGSNAGHGGADFNFDALVAQLSRPQSSASGGRSAGSDAITSAYAFIPRGLIATTSASSRTPLQDALSTYGNEVGDTIQSFENSNPNQAVILKNFIENRADAGAIAAMKKLGAEMARVGNTLGGMDPEIIPVPVRSAHTALVASYKDIGTKLSAIPDAAASGDTTLLAAIETYDAAANAFVKRYVALALIFQSYGVAFSPNEGGSSFTFSGGGF